MTIHEFKKYPKPDKKPVQLDTDVLAENCYYYMSLLRSFYELENSMTPEEFAIFLVAAERRYLEFMRSGHTDNLWKDSSPVPLDIAYAWHAHLLSPFRYYEDVGCNLNDSLGPLKWTDNFPLEAMHEHRLNKRLRITARNFYVTPYYFPVTELQKSHNVRWSDENPPSKEAAMPATMRKRMETPYIRCNSCNEELFFDSWKEYARFRTNPNVVLRCPSYLCSRKDNTVDMCAIQQLLSALPFQVKGTLLNSDGSKKKLDPDEIKAREAISEEIRARKDSINGVQDICDLLTNIQQSESRDTTGEVTKDYKAHAGELATIIRSTYENNPTGLSLDLIRAMLRQRDFICDMILKISPTWRNPMRNNFPAAIRDYHDFLLLIKNQQSDTAIHPTPIVDMVWHVHMLHPSRYHDMTMRELGRVLNHDDVIGPHRLEEHVTATEMAWKNAPLSLVDQGVINRMSQNAQHIFQPQIYIYDTLQEKLINQKQWRKMQGKGIFRTAKKLDIKHLSYHGLVNDDPFAEMVDSSERLSKELSFAAYQDVFEGIKGTGYGFIGTVLGQAIRTEDAEKRTIILAGTCPPNPPKYTKRCVGRIPPGSTIVVANGQLNNVYSGFQKDYAFPKLKDSNYQWWMPRYHHYGLMRRMYSKVHKQWGWTTDGFDWYSDKQCSFRVTFKGVFQGETFIVPRYLVHDRYRYKNGVLGKSSVFGGTFVPKNFHSAYADYSVGALRSWADGGFIGGDYGGYDGGYGGGGDGGGGDGGGGGGDGGGGGGD